jgi:hypothetical protein
VHVSPFVGLCGGQGLLVKRFFRASSFPNVGKPLLAGVKVDMKRWRGKSTK